MLSDNVPFLTPMRCMKNSGSKLKILIRWFETKTLQLQWYGKNCFDSSVKLPVPSEPPETSKTHRLLGGAHAACAVPLCKRKLQENYSEHCRSRLSRVFVRPLANGTQIEGRQQHCEVHGVNIPILLSRYQDLYWWESSKVFF